MPQPAHPARSQVMGHVSSSEAVQGGKTRQPPGTRARCSSWGSLLDQEGKKREAKRWLRKAANAGQQPWWRPTYEHHGLGGVSEPGAYALWKWSWEIGSGGRNEEAITQHPGHAPGP